VAESVFFQKNSTFSDSDKPAGNKGGKQQYDSPSGGKGTSKTGSGKRMEVIGSQQLFFIIFSNCFIFARPTKSAPNVRMKPKKRKRKSTTSTGIERTPGAELKIERRVARVATRKET
jgi:hypothetical protein